MILLEDTDIIISKSSDAVDLIRRILSSQEKWDRMKEESFVLVLNEERRVILLDLNGIGSIAAVDTPGFSLMDVVLHRKDCASIIFVHTHPCGLAQPSRADIDTMRGILILCRKLCIEVWDDIIISANGHYSVREEGLMERLKKGISDEIEAEGLIAKEMNGLNDHVLALQSRIDVLENSHRELIRILSENGVIRPDGTIAKIDLKLIDRMKDAKQH